VLVLMEEDRPTDINDRWHLNVKSKLGKDTQKAKSKSQDLQYRQQHRNCKNDSM